MSISDYTGRDVGGAVFRRGTVTAEFKNGKTTSLDRTVKLDTPCLIGALEKNRTCFFKYLNLLWTLMSMSYNDQIKYLTNIYRNILLFTI